MFNLSSILEEASKGYSSKIAFQCGKKVLTFEELNSSADKISVYLKLLGVKPGDKIALQCPNVVEFPLFYFAILKVGAVVVPMSILLDEKDEKFILSNSESTLLIKYDNGDFKLFSIKDSLKKDFNLKTILNGSIDRDFSTILLNPNDTAQIIYTSGTTGVPKGAELSHFSLFLNAKTCAEMFKLGPKDIILSALPFTHIFAQSTQMNAGIVGGCMNVLMPKFNPKDALSLIIHHGVTVFNGVPTMFWALNEVDSSYYQNSLRFCVSGGASIAEQIVLKFQEKYKAHIHEIFGMTESSGGVSFNGIGHKERKINSIGKSIWGVDIKIIDEDGNALEAGKRGELVYRGHCVMKGYYKNSAETELALKNGWMHSGDIAYMDKDGFLFIVDRKKDIIIRGGWKIYPNEIEAVLMEHGNVSIAAVVGEKNEKYGEEIAAYVVLNVRGSISSDELITWCKAKLAKYKYPRKIYFVDSLPLSKTGKVLKKELRSS